MYPLALGWGSAGALPFSTHLKPEIYINLSLNSLLSLEGKGRRDAKKLWINFRFRFHFHLTEPNIQFVGPTIDHSSGFSLWMWSLIPIERGWETMFYVILTWNYINTRIGKGRERRKIESKINSLKYFLGGCERFIWMLPARTELDICHRSRWILYFPLDCQRKHLKRERTIKIEWKRLQKIFAQLRF